MLTLPTENLEQTSEGTNLRIRTLGLRDLGPYTCQAYNGLGPAVSSSTVLKALGPVAPTGSREDEAYRAYVVEAPRAPGSPPIYRFLLLLFFYLLVVISGFYFISTFQQFTERIATF